MWAQYAEGHAGVCLAFDQALLKTEADLVANQRGLQLYKGDVHYRSDDELEGYLSLPVDVAHRDLEDLVEDLFPSVVSWLYFDKASDWRTETEYRFIRDSCSSGGDSGGPGLDVTGAGLCPAIIAR